jgi:predicted ATPase
LKHLIALYFQKLYERLKDYEPAVEYSQRLNRLNDVISEKPPVPTTPNRKATRSPGLWRTLLAEKERRESLALTRTLTNHEAALHLDSPKGLLLHGEVGTGKSMLVDLFADCLPTQKKRRWHFNTFMLETISKLEYLRRSRLSSFGGAVDEHSLLWLARDLIKTSPILFLDEFQLPDRMAAKTLSNLMTSFFHLGGVLIATSNRMPDELAKAAGMEYMQPPSTMDSLMWKLGMKSSDKSNRAFAGQGEFSNFLDLLKARCDVWEIESTEDYRRSDTIFNQDDSNEQSLESHLQGKRAFLGTQQSDPDVKDEQLESTTLPLNYFIHQSSDVDDMISPSSGIESVIAKLADRSCSDPSNNPWESSSLQIYGRKVHIPRIFNGAAAFTFDELCAARLGPADYISIASTYHTVFITDAPILTTALRNEARRFITLLDALYETKCKLSISAAAGPDDLFFPETRRLSLSPNGNGQEGETVETDDAMLSETFSEVHQDLISPFRPNISSYSPSNLAEDALEDDPPNRIRRIALSDLSEQDRMEALGQKPNFMQTDSFTGEDERFAYKRATSRLWEMCGARWWARADEGWWKPIQHRQWEVSINPSAPASIPCDDAGVAREAMGDFQKVGQTAERTYSPFRADTKPPPKIEEEHVWGVTKWGRKAGPWGQGVEGLQNRVGKNDK